MLFDVSRVEAGGGAAKSLRGTAQVLRLQTLPAESPPALPAAVRLLWAGERPFQVAHSTETLSGKPAHTSLRATCCWVFYSLLHSNTAHVGLVLWQSELVKLPPACQHPMSAWEGPGR